MKIAIICEFSGAVRDAFTKLGHDAGINFKIKGDKNDDQRGNIGDAAGM